MYQWSANVQEKMQPFIRIVNRFSSVDHVIFRLPVSPLDHQPPTVSVFVRSSFIAAVVSLEVLDRHVIHIDYSTFVLDGIRFLFFFFVA